jgi:hypothetical protein
MMGKVSGYAKNDYQEDIFATGLVKVVIAQTN